MQATPIHAPKERGCVLCGTDFSEKSYQAADVAAIFAKQMNLPLRLIHATVLPLSPLNEGSMRAERARLLATGVEIITEVLEGSAVEVLCEAAARHSARLMIISSVGMTAPARWLLGSVAERAADYSPVPTLVVREAESFAAWARGERVLRIFVGVDFTASADAGLRWVAQLAKLGACEVVAGFVSDVHDTWQGAMPVEVLSPLETLPETVTMQKALEHDVREKVKRVAGLDPVEVSVAAKCGSADVPLVDMAIEAQADLVVVGAHQWHGLNKLRHGTVSRGIIRYAPVSVTCVPQVEATRKNDDALRIFSRVLLACDLNEAHGFGAPYAYSLVKPGGTVRLLYHLDTFRLPAITIYGDGSEPEADAIRKKAILEAERRLRAIVPKEAEARGITTEVLVTEGRDAAEAICAAAEHFEADVICVGRHTHSGLLAKALGSVALAVVQTSKRPVLVLCPPDA